MVVDVLPIQKVQSRSLSRLDDLTIPGQHGNLIKEYLIACAAGDHSDATVQAYRWALTIFARWCQDRPLTRQTIRLYLLHMKERAAAGEISATTVHDYFRPLRSLCNWMVAEGKIGRDENPMTNVDAPRLPVTTIKPCKPEEIQQILVMCNGDRFTDIRDRAIVLLFYDSCLRLKELAAIQLQHVNLDEQTIWVSDGKGQRERYVAFSKDTKSALQRYILMRKDGHDALWVTEERRPMARRSIQTQVRRLCVEAGVACKKGPHALRHGSATSMLRGGADVKMVKELLGHSTLDMTMRYVQTITSEDAVKAHRQFSPVERLKKK